MPIYPALALLLGSAMDSSADNRWFKASSKTLGIVYAAAVAMICVILYAVRTVPATGDISSALQQHPNDYTLSLGHMGDLTLRSFAYLRTPLVIAALACMVGLLGAWFLRRRGAILAIATSMIIFFHAARLAMVVFDPYLSSRPLAERLVQAPPGQVIIDGTYYPFSSLLYYSGRDALLLNGRYNNLEYGSYAPGSPPVFIDDDQFARLWSSGSRYYLASDGTRLDILKKLTGSENLYEVAQSGGKFLFTNHPAETTQQLN